MLTRVLLLTQVTTALVGVLLAGNPQLVAEPRPSGSAALVTAMAAGPEPVARPKLPAAHPRPAVHRTLPRKDKVVRPTARHRTSHRATTVRRTVVRTRTFTASPQQQMQAAVLRLPGYRPGSTTWVISPAYGSWGTADWYNNTVYISPSVPSYRMYDVVAHEWSHVISVRPYSDVRTATASMNSWFGGSGLTGPERAADCMARQLGAQWTHYTSCPDAHWQAGARMLLSGQPLS